jgi:hypothetical protein
LHEIIPAREEEFFPSFGGTMKSFEQGFRLAMKTCGMLLQTSGGGGKGLIIAFNITPANLRTLARLMEQHGEENSLQIEIPPKTWSDFLRERGTDKHFGEMMVWFHVEEGENPEID